MAWNAPGDPTSEAFQRGSIMVSCSHFVDLPYGEAVPGLTLLVRAYGTFSFVRSAMLSVTLRNKSHR